MSFKLIFNFLDLLRTLGLDCLVVNQGLCYCLAKLFVGDESLLTKVSEIVTSRCKFAVVACESSVAVGYEDDFCGWLLFTELAKLVRKCAFDLIHELIGDLIVLFLVSREEGEHFIVFRLNV